MFKTIILPVAGYIGIFCVAGAIIGATAGYIYNKRKVKRLEKHLAKAKK